MTFGPNQYLEDKAIKKIFTVHEAEGGTKLSSSKSAIDWKEGKDLTQVKSGGAPSFFSFFQWEGGDKGFRGGEELAVTLVEDIWPNAIKYFTESFEESDEPDEEIDLESEEDEEESERDEPPKKKLKNGM